MRRGEAKALAQLEELQRQHDLQGKAYRAEVKLRDQLCEEGKKLMDAITKHRNAKGHERCWQNDHELYKTAGLDVALDGNQIPSREEFMRACEAYYEGQTQTKGM